MAISTGAAILGAAALGGGVSYLSGRAASDAQQDAAQNAAGIQREQLGQNERFFNTALELQRPGQQVGQQALNSLSVLFGLQPAVPSGVSPQQAIGAAQDRAVAAETGAPVGQVQQQRQAQQQASIPRQQLANVRGPQGQTVFLDQAQGAFTDGQGNVLSPIRDGQIPGLINGSDNPVVVRDGEVLGVGNRGVNRLASLSAPQQSPVSAGLTATALQSQTGRVPGGPVSNRGDVNGNIIPGGTPGGPAAQSGQTAQSAVPQTLQDAGFNDPVNSAPPTRQSVTSALEQFPVSRFLQTEGMRGIQGSAAARGSLQSGRTLRELVQFNQNLANAQSVQPFVSGLQSLAGVGQNAANAQQNAVQNFQGANQAGANNLANLALQSGNARASQFANTNQAVQGTLGNLTTAYLLSQGGGLGNATGGPPPGISPSALAAFRAGVS